MSDAEARAIGQVKAGNADAYRVLVDLHSRTVFRVAYRILGNEADAQDVVQEAFLRAYRQIGVFEERASFSTWIARIATNYALDLLRMRRPQCEPEVLEDVTTGQPSADRLYFNRQLERRMNEAIGELSAQERVAFLLRHHEGKSIEEIGEVLGTAPSATKNSIFRAVRKLRQALQPLVGSDHAAH